MATPSLCSDLGSLWSDLGQFPSMHTSVCTKRCLSSVTYKIGATSPSRSRYWVSWRGNRGYLNKPINSWTRRWRSLKTSRINAGLPSRSVNKVSWRDNRDNLSKHPGFTWRHWTSFVSWETSAKPPSHAWNRASSARQQEHWREADQLLAEALATLRQVRDRRRIARTLKEIGILKRQQGQFDDALHVLISAGIGLVNEIPLIRL